MTKDNENGTRLGQDKNAPRGGLDLAPLREALAALVRCDPTDFTQAAMIQAVGNLGHHPEPKPDPLQLAHLREIATYFQEGLHRCTILAALLSGKLMIVPKEDGTLQVKTLAPPEPTGPEAQATASAEPSQARQTLALRKAKRAGKDGSVPSKGKE